MVVTTGLKTSEYFHSRDPFVRPYFAVYDLMIRFATIAKKGFTTLIFLDNNYDRFVI